MLFCVALVYGQMNRWVVPPTVGTTIPGLKNLPEPNAIGEEGKKSHSHSFSSVQLLSHVQLFATP